MCVSGLFVVYTGGDDGRLSRVTTGRSVPDESGVSPPQREHRARSEMKEDIWREVLRSSADHKPIVD